MLPQPLAETAQTGGSLMAGSDWAGHHWHASLAGGRQASLSEPLSDSKWHRGLFKCKPQADSVDLNLLVSSSSSESRADCVIRN